MKVVKGQHLRVKDKVGAFILMGKSGYYKILIHKDLWFIKTSLRMKWVGNLDKCYFFVTYNRKIEVLKPAT